MLRQTRQEAPELVPWVVGHPRKALRNHEIWPQALAAYRWLRSTARGAWLRAVSYTHLDVYKRQVQVGAAHEAWRGAAERVLRGFALAVLVPAEHYEAATKWIDANHLGGRLVYYRVPARFVREDAPLTSDPILADLLEVRPGPHEQWLLNELRLRRANHVCVETVAALREQRGRAVTQAGQIKDRNRHEKDDRFPIGDRTRWVLGWTCLLYTSRCV